MNSMTWRRFLSPVGRLLLSFIFIAGGLSKLIAWNDTASMMASKGMPIASLFLALAILVELLGGLALLLGYRARGTSAILFFYLIPVTLIFHNFWNYVGTDAQLQLVNFMKNLAIMGGLLGTYLNGAGAVSIDANRRGEAPTPIRLRRTG